jgi:tetratricopeptide (TPR) repeat protein
VEPRPIQREAHPEAEAYRRLPTTGSYKDRMAAYQAFVDQYPGTQLALRAMRDVSVFYLLQDKSGQTERLEACAEWLGRRLSSPQYAWIHYATASDSLRLDRIETQLVYARILSGIRRLDDALSSLAEVLVEGESRPDLWNARPDLKEQIDFARCWCFHGKLDYRSALNSYQRFIEAYPTSDYMPAALRNAAMCMTELDPQGGRETINLYLSRLKEEYPKSPEAADRDVARILGQP